MYTHTHTYTYTQVESQILTALLKDERKVKFILKEESRYPEKEGKIVLGEIVHQKSSKVNRKELSIENPKTAKWLCFGSGNRYRIFQGGLPHSGMGKEELSNGCRSFQATPMHVFFPFEVLYSK